MSLKIVAMSASVKTRGRAGSGSASTVSTGARRARRRRCRTDDGHARMRSRARAWPDLRGARGSAGAVIDGWSALIRKSRVRDDVSYVAESCV